MLDGIAQELCSILLSSMYLFVEKGLERRYERHWEDGTWQGHGMIGEIITSFSKRELSSEDEGYSAFPSCLGSCWVRRCLRIPRMNALGYGATG